MPAFPLILVFRYISVDMAGSTLLPKALTDLSGLQSHTGTLVVAWGRNSFGQLGVGETFDAREHGRADDMQRTPQIVPALTDRPVADLSCGEEFCLALVAGDGVYGWGAAGQGRLGERRGVKMVPTPSLLPFTHHKTLSMISAGSFHALALRYEGIVLSWGSNENGQLGWGRAPGVSHVAGQAEVPQSAPVQLGSQWHAPCRQMPCPWQPSRQDASSSTSGGE